MYGIINKFISTTVVRHYGQDQWDLIKQNLEFESESFVEMQPYSDEVTFGIVGAVVNKLEIDLALFLEQMGYDWVLETATGSYRSMYALAGGSLFGFLDNLNNMHQVIAAQMTELIPPSFICTRTGTGDIRVKYFSERDGLDPFVIGLLKGLCTHFETPGTITQISVKSDAQPFSEFMIQLQ